MHVKSFVLASFAIGIVTAIPIPSAEPQFCPVSWKRSPQSGCLPQTLKSPQTLKLPSLDDIPLQQPTSNGLGIYPTDGFSSPALVTPANPVVTQPQPPPQPLNDVAPFLAIPGAGFGAWALDKLLRGGDEGAPIKGN
ncbi:hypothetical protein MMC31_007307 [Peltigera leucophlebia]|nr:hypothetical protein [Peltigera leucophlebia]